MRSTGETVGQARTVTGIRTAALAAAGLVLVAGCGGSGQQGEKAAGRAGHPSATPATGLKRIPGVGERLQSRIPADSRQVIAVYGDGKDDTTSTVVLYTKGEKGAADNAHKDTDKGAADNKASKTAKAAKTSKAAKSGANGADTNGTGADTWSRDRTWQGHNGKRGWALDHHEGDKRSPVGVYSLSDAGGVLPDPGAKLPYTATAAFTPPSYWAKKTRHDFDYVIAIDYNRDKGVSPLDPARPEGQSKGGSIWLHMDHGSGTSGCVSIPKSGMRYLLRTLDPAQHPVVVMGDKADLKA
ncbi:hypothetical protein ABZ840_37465 [Streptomyces sp. NPDC047117]|uniref:hypothetical protein n=1 Tax=Streptomyces sp. NPDC047117 TaxID=3155379 RepID=UPI0033C04545